MKLELGNLTSDGLRTVAGFASVVGITLIFLYLMYAVDELKAYVRKIEVSNHKEKEAEDNG